MNDDIIYNGLTSSAYTDDKFWLEEAKTILSDYEKKISGSKSEIKKMIEKANEEAVSSD